MKFPRLQRRTLALVAVIIPLLLLFIYVALRSGPLAPIAATVSTVESCSVAPALAGIGTVQARFTYKIGPTVAGRVKRLDVHVGDIVKAGQVLGEMDAVDLDEAADDAGARAMLGEALNRRGPCLIHVSIDVAEKVFPMVPAGFSNDDLLLPAEQEARRSALR